MSELDVDLDDKNAVGALDRLVTNVAMAAVAVVPTLGAAIATPWKLVNQINGDFPHGKQGMFLSPGAFLPLAMTVVLLFAALVTTPETVANNGGEIGPRLAVAVAEAAGAGDLWRTVSLIAPIYALAIAVGVVGQVLRPFTGDWWTLRASLRAAFYQIGAAVCWIILSSAAIDAIRLSVLEPGLGTLLYNLNAIPIFGLTLWIYFWTFRTGTGAPIWKAALLAIAMVGLIIALIAGSSALFFSS